MAAGDRRIVGVMIEINLVAGRQDLVPGVDADLRPVDHRWVHRLGRPLMEVLERLANAAATRREARSRWLDRGHLPAHLRGMQIPASLRQLPNQLTMARRYSPFR